MFYTESNDFDWIFCFSNICRLVTQPHGCSDVVITIFVLYDKFAIVFALITDL